MPRSAVRYSRQPSQRAHVPARAAGGLHAAVVGAEQVVADLGAVGVARLGGLDEPDPRAHEQRLDRRDA